MNIVHRKRANTIGRVATWRRFLFPYYSISWGLWERTECRYDKDDGFIPVARLTARSFLKLFLAILPSSSIVSDGRRLEGRSEFSQGLANSHLLPSSPPYSIAMELSESISHSVALRERDFVFFFIYRFK